jgi:hypothetical protein
MSARAPEVDVRDYLASLPGAPFGAADTNIRCGFPRSPVQPGTNLVGIWVDVSERGPVPYYGAASNDYTADLDVKVVSAPEDLDGGWAKARELRDALQAKAPTGYRSCLNTLLRYLGTNEAQQHIHGANFTLTWSA